MDVSTASLAPVDLVARIMDDVRETFPKDEALVIALAKEGVVSDGGRPYSSKTVSAWATGKGMPPGHVVLIAARLAGLRLDRYLYPEEAGSTNKEDRERLDRLEARHEQDIQALREEFRKTLQAEMLELREELRGLGRIGRGISTELDEDKRPT